MTCYAYFEGSLDQFFLTKTVKTMCGKRVARAKSTVTGHVECPACRKVLEERIASANVCADGVEAGKEGFVSDNADANARMIATWRADAERIVKVLAQ